MSTICVIGLGYIGLPTATLLAFSGHQVTGVDINNRLVAELNCGKVTIEEPNLEELFNQAIMSGNLNFSPHPQPADAFFIAVPTPCTTDRVCDLYDVLSAVDSLIPCLRHGNTVILESTVPPGTCQDIIRPRLEKAGFTMGKDLYLAYCPERVLPGDILRELVNNNRIIGGCTPGCGSVAAEYYRSFVRGNLLFTDSRTAEMTKLMENTFRDLNIALANETALICHELGINVLEVITLANQHPRVNILNPGPGVGGHCLAVDPYFIIEKAPALSRLISMARRINNEMPGYITQLVMHLLAHISNAKIAVFGISYKGNVGDCRESPALEVTRMLRKSGYAVSIFDPHVELENNDLTITAKDADMILILSDHDDFRSLDYQTLSMIMRTPIVFDTRNLLNPSDFADSSITLLNLGNIMTYAKQ